MKTKAYTFHSGEQVRVVYAETDEDVMYLGEGPNCDHALHPTDCIHCNPEYRKAYWAICPKCSHDRPGSVTWHIPVLTDITCKCLKCGHNHHDVEEAKPCG